MANNFPIIILSEINPIIYPQIKNNLKRQDITKEDVQKTVDEAVKDVNKKLPKYKKIRSYDISETEFEKTTTKKIKRQANIEKKKQRNNKNDFRS